MKIKLIATKTELLEYAHAFDDETKDYCINDCIKCWDNKNYWTSHQPPLFALVTDDEKELVSVIFWSRHWIGESGTIEYIERLFTPKKYRNQGHFTFLLNTFFELSFERQASALQLFTKNNVNLYKELNFIPLFPSKNNEYQYCLMPVICKDLKLNNMLIAKNGIDKFLSIMLKKHIEIMKKKYA